MGHGRPFSTECHRGGEATRQIAHPFRYNQQIGLLEVDPSDCGKIGRLPSFTLAGYGPLLSLWDASHYPHFASDASSRHIQGSLDVIY
jgi:hypothetical protein